MIQGGHGYGGNHGDLLAVVLEDEHDIEVLDAEADSLKVTELQVLEGDHEGRPGGQVHEAAGGGLQEDGLSVRNTLTNNILTLEEIEFNTYTEA